MKVTSDSLFHFTTSLDNLKSILSKKFKLTYCHEKYLLDYETHDSYFPMVSFCDIPLSLAKDQINKYGSYAIGMTKEWGIKNNLNPVVYIEKGSLLAKDIQATIDNMIKMTKPISAMVKKNTASVQKATLKAVEHLNTLIQNYSSENKDLVIKYLNDTLENLQNNSYHLDYKELVDSLIAVTNNNKNLFRYIKNYQGTQIRNNKTNFNYRFYDEREWRYVPALNDNRIKESLSKEEFKEYRGLGKIKPFVENINLPFNSNDIKYLIVKSNKDIPVLIKSIKSTNNLANNTNDADILTTRIITIEQLYSDF
jgi:Putative abortive phage resistance protein AbiGi, antitoxin